MKSYLLLFLIVGIIVTLIHHQSQQRHGVVLAASDEDVGADEAAPDAADEDEATITPSTTTSATGQLQKYGTIEGRLQYPDRTPYNITTRVSVNHNEYLTYSRARDGRFTIYNVRPGIHTLDVQSATHHFSQIKLQFVEDDMTHPNCIEYTYPGAHKKTVPQCQPLLIMTVIAAYDYFETKRGFSILSILKNPMILLMLFSAGMMFLMPKMMENMEPEEKERMKKQMEAQQDPAKMIGNLWSEISGTAAAAADEQQQASGSEKKKSSRKTRK